jgi:exosome complex component RRP4
MAITILPPMIEEISGNHLAGDDDSSHGYSDDSDGDIDMEDGGVSLSKKRTNPRAVGKGRGKSHTGGSSGIVAPGDLVTDDPQWMR